MQAVMYATNARMGENTSKKKNYNRLFIMYTHALMQFYLNGLGATTFIQRKPRKGKSKNWASWAFNSSRSCGDRKSSERPCWLPAAFVATRWVLLDVPTTRQLA